MSYQYRGRCHSNIATISDDIKARLVQSQDSDVSLISQIDIVNVFHLQYFSSVMAILRRCHSNIVTISECPLGSRLVDIADQLTAFYIMETVVLNGLNQ